MAKKNNPLIQLNIRIPKSAIEDLNYLCVHLKKTKRDAIIMLVTQGAENVRKFLVLKKEVA